MEKFTELVERDQITVEVIAKPSTTIKDSEGWEHYPWTLRLKDGPVFPGKTLDVSYRTGSGHTVGKTIKQPKAPSVTDVMYSLVMDAQTYYNSGSFEDWSSDLGYDSDSIKALGIYNEVAAQTKRLQTFLGVPKFEEYMNCEVDY